jgi:hypothetical protein
MAKSKTNGGIPSSYLVNGAMIVVGLATVSAGVFGMTSRPVASNCSERLGHATQFQLLNAAGKPVSAGELQARLAGRDWGVLENAKIYKTPEGAPALQINMPKTVATESAPAAASGLGFSWLPSGLSQASSACLSYKIWLPADFDFAKGGVLPGLFGEDPANVAANSATEAKPGFATRLRWAAEGRIEARVATADLPNGGTFRIQTETFEIPRGRWVQFDQEVILNEPNSKNGVMRLWIDGALKFESESVGWRSSTAGSFQGVAADVHYIARDGSPVSGPVPTTIRLSPLEVRWD